MTLKHRVPRQRLMLTSGPPMSPVDDHVIVSVVPLINVSPPLGFTTVRSLTPPLTVTAAPLALVAPSLSVTSRTIVYVPAVVYTRVGCCAADDAPSPKSHSQETMLPSLSVLVSVKLAVKPLTVSVKLETGGSFTLITTVVGTLVFDAPSLSVTISVTT